MEQTFDTLATARRLKEAGVDARQAEAMTEATDQSRVNLVTQEYLDSCISALRADLYRALWIQGASIIGMVFAMIGAATAVLTLVLTTTP